MLKIKDNVDLKELEKYGFKKNEIEFTNCYIKRETKGYIEINEHHYISLLDFTDSDYPVVDESILDTLYDLIKADLVEKVSEEK